MLSIAAQSELKLMNGDNILVFIDKYLFYCLTHIMLHISIDVASYGALEHVLVDFQMFNFSGHFRAAQTLDI